MGDENEELLIAAKSGDADRAKRALDRGADCQARDAEGKTALDYAVFLGLDSLARELAKRGAKLDAEDRDGLQPLHVAAEMNHPEVAAALIEAGAPLDGRDGDGWTPLHWASAQGNARMVQLLITAGSDLEARTHDGRTPLLLVAMLSGDERAAETLLEAGADLDAMDTLKQKAEDLARTSGFLSLEENLRARRLAGKEKALMSGATGWSRPAKRPAL